MQMPWSAFSRLYFLKFGTMLARAKKGAFGESGVNLQKILANHPLPV